MDQDPNQVATRLQDVVVEFGLRRATATTDTHTVTVEEPSIWERSDPSELNVEIRELDI